MPSWKNRLEAATSISEWDSAQDATPDASKIHEYLVENAAFSLQTSVGVDDVYDWISDNRYSRLGRVINKYKPKYSNESLKEIARLRAYHKYKEADKERRSIRSRFTYAYKSLNSWLRDAFDVTMIRKRVSSSDGDFICIALCKESVSYYLRLAECGRSRSNRDVKFAKRCLEKLAG